jgi:hypothetical protein
LLRVRVLSKRKSKPIVIDLRSEVDSLLVAEPGPRPNWRSGRHRSVLVGQKPTLLGRSGDRRLSIVFQSIVAIRRLIVVEKQSAEP